MKETKKTIDSLFALGQKANNGYQFTYFSCYKGRITKVKDTLNWPRRYDYIINIMQNKKGHVLVYKEIPQLGEDCSTKQLGECL